MTSESCYLLQLLVSWSFGKGLFGGEEGREKEMSGNARMVEIKMLYMNDE